MGAASGASYLVFLCCGILCCSKTWVKKKARSKKGDDDGDAIVTRMTPREALFAFGASRLGIDVGGVISGVDTDGGERRDGGGCGVAPLLDENCIAPIAKLVRKFGAENTFILSKCGTEMQRKTVLMLDGGDFFARTGLPRGNVYFCGARGGVTIGKDSVPYDAAMTQLSADGRGACRVSLTVVVAVAVVVAASACFAVTDWYLCTPAMAARPRQIMPPTQVALRMLFVSRSQLALYVGALRGLDLPDGLCRGETVCVGGACDKASGL